MIFFLCSFLGVYKLLLTLKMIHLEESNFLKNILYDVSLKSLLVKKCISLF